MRKTGDGGSAGLCKRVRGVSAISFQLSVLSYQLPASRVFSLTHYLQSYLIVQCLLISEYRLLNTPYFFSYHLPV